MPSVDNMSTSAPGSNGTGKSGSPASEEVDAIIGQGPISDWFNVFTSPGGVEVTVPTAPPA